MVYYDDTQQESEPPWTTWIMEEAGFAAFRSGWTEKDVFGALVAENGSMRKTLHDHVDGLSFGIAAHGDFLLMDTGYYKPIELSLPRTAQAGSHNVILIDGKGAPDKGLLWDFGDEDATLTAISESFPISYAQGVQTYEDTTITRGMAFVKDSYFVIADRLQTDSIEERVHSWRMHPYVGENIGGDLVQYTDGIHISREKGAARVYLASTQGELNFVEVPLVDELSAPHVHQIERSGGVQYHRVIDGETTATSPYFLAVILPHAIEEVLPKAESS